MRAKSGWLVVVVVAIAFVAALGWQFKAVTALRADVEREKISAAALARVRDQHGRLLAAQPATGEIEWMTAEAAALPQLRTDVMALRQQVQQAEGATTEKKEVVAERFGVGSKVVAAEWKNAGTATPQATLETVLWSGAGGNVDAFANTLHFMGSQTRKAAQALREDLPEPMRSQYSSPEQLIAFLTVRDVPLGSVQVRTSIELNGWPGPAQLMQLLLRDADGKPKESTLLFMNPGDGWKLVVTDGVVAKYAAMLKDSKGVAGGK